ncbi:Recombination protein O [Neorhizobium galegae bv. officinalis bv. officinalis str. HAMBI 1141]|uniref:DNA repair protein RecO n=1 Tax=Neorhizobium galegae bv. officinalis bv. officinalis str. HAMBI 1141 TaxID=1028801 RepID=A0A068T493_NEOGA|nr:DNA repair protein RecO [Neorhizobium galegae]CDN53312.1 Recombination protein O [Neorhizobium galegae bv. officinalis bv. officinalis str. HAMBI 1141]
MQWQDEAIIIGVKRHGETSVIAELMTRDRGRHLGLVRSGRSRAMQPVLQAGNRVEAVWRARLDEHLGEFKLEPIRLRAAKLMETATAVYGVQAMGALLRLLPERDPHPHLFEALDIILDAFDDPSDAGELFVRFELAVLNDLGFGLDLTECAATGGRKDLVYVSPKTGRAVSREAGMPYADRMLALPGFLSEGAASAADRDSMAEAFRLTGYFLHRHVYEPRGLTENAARDGFVQAALKALSKDTERQAG